MKKIKFGTAFGDILPLKHAATYCVMTAEKFKALGPQGPSILPGSTVGTDGRLRRVYARAELDRWLAEKAAGEAVQHRAAPRPTPSSRFTLSRPPAPLWAALREHISTPDWGRTREAGGFSDEVAETLLAVAVSLARSGWDWPQLPARLGGLSPTVWTVWRRRAETWARRGVWSSLWRRMASRTDSRFQLVERLVLVDRQSGNSIILSEHAPYGERSPDPTEQG